MEGQLGCERSGRNYCFQLAIKLTHERKLKETTDKITALQNCQKEIINETT